MATITGLTAARMLEIEDASIIDGEIVSGHLILTKHDGTTIDAGPVVGPPGPTGPTGPASISAIPGEIKLWPGGALPELVTYGKWDWCDGGVLAVATYPLAASHIDASWKTFGGASDPGAGNFRKPDMRGLVPAGLDAMPDGSGGHGTRANRTTRAVAIILAGRAGEETHVVTVAEMPAHAHTVNDPGHYHTISESAGGQTGGVAGANMYNVGASNTSAVLTGVTVNNNGGGGAHENLQPTVFVPYIVKLDD